MSILPPHFIKPRTVLDMNEDQVYAMLELVRERRLVAERGHKRRNAAVDSESNAAQKKRIMREFDRFRKNVDKLEDHYTKMMASWQTILGLRMSIGDDVLAEIAEMQNAKSNSDNAQDGSTTGAGSGDDLQDDGS